MINETGFPHGEIADRYAEGFILPWFKRCIADYPNIKAILEADPMPNMSRAFQALLLVNEWKVKWFSQFAIGDKV